MSEISTIIKKLKEDINNENNIFYYNGTVAINNDCLKLFYINKENKPDYIKIPNENQNKINDLINSCNNKGHEYILPPDKFSLDNNFYIYNTEIIHLIHKTFKYNIDVNKIYSELKCLKIYTKDNIYKPIVLNKNDKKIGSIVMILPSIFDDADINITNRKNTKTFNLSNNNLLIKWYSFNSDYNYEITNIKKGQIITLTYDLYINCNRYSKNINLKDINFFNILKELSKKGGNTLGFMLQHRYMDLVNFNNKNTDFMEILKGTDLKLFLLCKELKLEIEFTGIIFLEYISRKQIKEIFDDEYNSDDEDVKKLVIENMKNLDHLLINDNDARIRDENDLLIMLKNAGAEYRSDIKWVNNCKYSYYTGSYTEYLDDGIGGGYVIHSCLVTGAFLVNI